jgi:hypothetical protein
MKKMAERVMESGLSIKGGQSETKAPVGVVEDGY